jgi:hypothetical protein
MSRNVHVLCSCRKQSLHYCGLQIIYILANNSLSGKGHEQNVHTWLHAALPLISKSLHLLTTADAVHTVQFKVNATDSYGNGLFAYRPTAALIGYAAPVCVVRVNAIESYYIAFCQQQNLLHS